jgi:hypothetical protein
MRQLNGSTRALSVSFLGLLKFSVTPASFASDQSKTIT